MALDAKHRSSLYNKFVPLLGEDDANALMSEFPASEADELVTKQLLRAEMAELRQEFADFRADIHETLRRQTITTLGVFVAAAAAIEALGSLV